jgi:bifunctional DNase/RNase
MDMTLDVQDAASVGATVNSITLNATSDTTTFAPLTFSSDDIKREAGTTHVDGRATLSIPLSIVYNTPSGKANLSVSVSVQLTDDRNNQVTATGQTSVL